MGSTIVGKTIHQCQRVKKYLKIWLQPFIRILIQSKLQDCLTTIPCSLLRHRFMFCFYTCQMFSYHCDVKSPKLLLTTMIDSVCSAASVSKMMTCLKNQSCVSLRLFFNDNKKHTFRKKV